MDDKSHINYEYDVAISYAGEDRESAEALAGVLRNRGVNIFYDRYEIAVLWGEDLYTKLSDIYQKKAHYCIAFLSKHYVAKVWTKHELQAAQARALKEQNAYLLPIRLDDAEIPGVLPTIAYLDWNKETPETIADLLVDKLKRISQASSKFAQKLSQEAVMSFVNEASSQVILILGRFTKERKLVLDALRDELSSHNYSPVTLDFDHPAKRDLSETISTLAHMSRFIIVDLTDAKSIPQELQLIIPHMRVPVQPILHIDATAYAMFEDYYRYPWVLPTYHYKDIVNLIASIKVHIIKPLEQKEYENEEENRKWREEFEKLREEK